MKSQEKIAEMPSSIDKCQEQITLVRAILEQLAIKLKASSENKEGLEAYYKITYRADFYRAKLQRLQLLSENLEAI